jgi:general secretion pathway protein D
MVMFHPSYPEQFQKLKKVVQETIDRPARQVFVEGLVLEISTEALRDLGVNWSQKKGSNSISLGTLTTPGPGDSALSFLRDSTVNITPQQIMAKINALVQTNKAEVLSRPSVLTLDNRQATIRVGTDIPVATSKDASAAGSGSSRVAFSFQYLPTGILMNIRPRISEDGNEISMLIDATVSATVPNQDLKVLDPATRVTLASAPTISTRRVQTYARIRDNMPLIIGGLVSRDQISGSDKVPLAGEIPFLGRLFGHENAQDRKREVIIVLTPSVVTENIRETKAQSPRDDYRFDLRDTVIFKEHYRIRAEDLVDSSYIRFNRRFLTYREIANRVIERDQSLATRAPFSAFQGTKVPGEFIFVSGMLYKMLDRMDAGAPIKIENLMTFERIGDEGEQRPISLVQLMARYGDGKNHLSFFDKNRGKALALTFKLARNSTRSEDMFAEPVPKISLVDCASRDDWRRMLWDMNQSTGATPSYTILIQEPSDLRRIQLAYATQNTILNNGGTGSMIFDKWLPGRMLHLQEVSATWERVLLPPIAQYFFIGEHAAMYFTAEHEAAIQALDRGLRRKENATLIEGIALP